ncbi:MAG TPA: hypothetical protein EYN67_18555 [Flavobacteriales bacterium]|nr:hypothetical protein [Methylococcaceae bacterium]HHZ97490.1 hypothetical protein [Flavobacteriales bacterium]
MPLIGRVNLDLAIDDLVNVTNDNLRGVYLAGLKNIVQGTPADSGRARNNWFLSVGAPSNKITTSSSVGGGGSLSQASKMPKDVLNNTIFFTNNLPYIGVLEYGGFPSPVEKGSYIKRSKSFEILSINGFSKQAPNGWVRKTVIQMQNKIRSL